jgi:alkylated DNA repair dioxygenase AlkB
MNNKIDLSSDSWIEVDEDSLKFNKEDVKELMELCPKTKNQIKIYGKTLDIPRFEQLFGSENYTYSGVERIANPNIPTLVEKCLTLVKEKYPQHEWNGALVNWYLDGSHYIGSHSDSERGLKNGAPIVSFSFGGERTFRIKRKKKQESGECSIEKKDVITKNGLMISMMGKMQQEYKHEITKTKKKVLPRINITIRSFLSDDSKKSKRIKPMEEEEEK